MEEEGIGVGGVALQITFLASETGDDWVNEEKVIERIIKRYEVGQKAAKLAISMSEKFGVVVRKDGKVRVKSRTEKPY